MKNKNQFILTIWAALLSGQLFAQTPVSDSVSMGAGYGKAVYYNIRTGAEASSPVDQWHFSHTTVSRDNCIRVNHMGGVEVYAYPKGDNSKFSQFDTSGWAAWKKFYNDINVHEKGALNQAANPGNMWDFSWGVYDPTTKDVNGDSLYLLVITHPGIGTGKSFVKFMPIKQNANGDFIFRTAMVDGTSDKTDTMLQSSATGKSYKYYTLGVGDVYPEPSRDNWDLLFTRYYALTTPPGGGTPVMYPTMGVESKRGTRVSKITTYTWDVMAANPAQTLIGVKMTGTPSELSKDLTKIGGDWKSFDNSTGKWTIQTSWNYVVESTRTLGAIKDTAYYMMSFTGFTGSSRGESQFRKLALTPTASVRSEKKQAMVKLFPNPVQNSLMIWAPEQKSVSSVNILSADGRIVLQQTIDFSNETAVSLDVTALTAGTYFVQISSETDRVQLPFVKH
ncbi:MAG: hypothetical protein RL525_381 [Bacteroidota bacterium]|jgi:hypothetical protein